MTDKEFVLSVYPGGRSSRIRAHPLAERKLLRRSGWRTWQRVEGK